MTRSAVSTRQIAHARQEAEQRFRLKSERVRRSGRILDWSEGFRKEAGHDLDFDTFPFQRELYEAFGDKTLDSVDVMKSAQCGISAAAVSLSLFAADVWKANVLYVLPTGDDAFSFSDTRVKPAIDNDPYLRMRVASTDNKGLKRIGEANIYFRGSMSERKALSIPADILVLDEYDRLDQKNIPAFRRRLNAPKSLRLERRFSNPSFPEAGIHRLYLDSDQREWLVKCSCRHEAPIFYDQHEDSHHVDEGAGVLVCGRCSKELRASRIAGGRWVARYTGRAARGYHVSRLIIPYEDIPAIVAEHQKRAEEEVQAHYNFDLGLPYSPKGGSLSREQVLSNRRDYSHGDGYSGGNWVTAGIDVGAVLHVRISEWRPGWARAVSLYIGELDTFEDLYQVMRRYSVNFAVIDERPEERKAREFQHEFYGRVLLCRWSGDDQRDPVVIDKEQGLVIARRTGACDRLVAAFDQQHRLLPRDLPRGYLEQVTAPHRVIEQTNRGQKVARYISERADHFFFAECYDLLAKEAWGEPAADAGVDPDPIKGRLWR